MGRIHKQELVAYHESGHCVTAAYLKCQTKGAWIGECDGGYHHDTEWRARNDLEHRQYRLNEIIIFQAGRAAVDRLSGCKQSYPDWETSNDHKLSLKRAMWLSGDDEQCAGLLLQWAARRAECLVTELWDEVQKLAFALLEHEKLSADQIKETLAA